MRKWRYRRVIAYCPFPLWTHFATHFELARARVHKPQIIISVFCFGFFVFRSSAIYPAPRSWHTQMKRSAIWCNVAEKLRAHGTAFGIPCARRLIVIGMTICWRFCIWPYHRPLWIYSSHRQSTNCCRCAEKLSQWVKSYNFSTITISISPIKISRIYCKGKWMGAGWCCIDANAIHAAVRQTETERHVILCIHIDFYLFATHIRVSGVWLCGCVGSGSAAAAVAAYEPCCVCGAAPHNFTFHFTTFYFILFSFLLAPPYHAGWPHTIDNILCVTRKLSTGENTTSFLR